MLQYRELVFVFILPVAALGDTSQRKSSKAILSLSMGFPLLTLGLFTSTCCPSDIVSLWC